MIELFRFLQQERAFLRSGVVPLSVAAGLTRGLLIMLINAAVLSAYPVSVLAPAAFVILAVHIVCLHKSRMAAYRLIEQIQCNLRTRLIHKLLHVDATFFFGREAGELYNVLSNNITSIAQNAVRFLTSLQSIVLVVFCFFYLFWLSPLTGVTTIATIVLACSACVVLDRGGRSKLTVAHEKTSAFFDRVQDTVHGFKEVRLNEPRRRGLEAHVARLLGDVGRLSIEAERKFSMSQSTAQAFMFLQLGVIAILLPVFVHTDTTVAFQVLTVALFMYGPIDLLIGGYPGLARSRVWLERLRALQAELDAATMRAPAAAAPAATQFGTISLEGVVVSLADAGGAEAPTPADEDRFVVGPIDLTIRRGEVVFIHGGNGSGKTTLMSALSGLRQVDAGRITIDGTPVDPNQLGSYRALFSAVFADYHLFKHLYGFPNEGFDKLAAAMAELDLPKRIAVADGAFNSLSASAGQRRRLALSVALAEDRPVVLFDEFAADQDPAHRAFFYERLLPELRAQGRTVIAITHDENRFHLCDQLIKMDQGRIAAIQRGHLATLDLPALGSAPRIVVSEPPTAPVVAEFRPRGERRPPLAGGGVRGGEARVESLPEVRGRAADS